MAEEEAILFHAANGVEIAEDDFAVIKKPAIEAGEVAHLEKFKNGFGLGLDFLDNFEAETGGGMVEGVGGGEVFFSVIEDLVVFVGSFYFGGDEGSWGTVGVLEEDDGEFFALAERFEENWSWYLGGFFPGFLR